MMTKISTYIKIFLFIFPLLQFTHVIAQRSKKPNIILVLVDDMGYSDIGAYGSEIHTPNIDKLSSEGTRFRQFYNNSICAPTRASVITGQYAHKAGIGYFNVNLGLPSYQGYLNKESLTFAEVLKLGGYQTFLSGKWHVGSDSSNAERPLQRGFDHFFGFLGGASSYQYGKHKLQGMREPGPLFEDNKPVNYSDDTSFYLTDVITDHAVQYVEDGAKSNQPFFLYLAYNAPHWPLQAREEDIAKYKGVYDIGWDSLRTQRFEKQKELGLLANGASLSIKSNDIPDWKNLTYDEQKLWAKKMEVYAAMVDRVDQGIGKVLDVLKKNNQDQNTLIIFISDNGAPVEDVHNVFGKVANEGPVGTSGSYESQGKSWSYASNTPFLGFKSYAYEGGISSPFVAWFPGKIKSGTIESGKGHIIDLAPTFYDITGIKYPAVYKGKTTNPLPGKSLQSVLFRNENLVDRNLFGERAGNRWVLSGKWKLVSIYPSYEWELYNLEEDRGETNNIASQNKELVNKLSRLYFDWAKENGVVDFNNIKPNRPLLPTSDKKGVQAY